MFTTYPIDDIIKAYLLQASGPEKYNRINNLFTIINSLNLLTNNDNIMNIEEVEAELLDIIFGEDTESSSKLETVEVFIKNSILTYLSRYDIYLNKNILFMELEEILKGWYLLYTIDPELSELLYDTIDDELTEDELILAQLLEDRTELSVVEIYELIEDISSDCLLKLKTFVKESITDKLPELSEENMLKINYLAIIDPIFLNTDFITNVNVNGYVSTPIQNLLASLYNRLEKYSDNYFMIPYEIVATFYFASDVNGMYLEEIHDKINYENISYLHGDFNKINLIAGLVEELAAKIKD